MGPATAGCSFAVACPVNPCLTLHLTRNKHAGVLLTGDGNRGHLEQ